MFRPNENIGAMFWLDKIANEILDDKNVVYIPISKYLEEPALSERKITKRIALNYLRMHWMIEVRMVRFHGKVETCFQVPDIPELV